ncbi:hypothetical protein Pcinc_023679 [Petrolisthes cinctipes]|uniref:Uncharacterized protein n=1 Tax=Petrolisthes cinctipes TaxID=88211 RepID=A0AAE1FCN1_PETCI|nr:hypothetical protein Pcinc_023679 [Petrolisthes cinctipes]
MAEKIIMYMDVRRKEYLDNSFWNLEKFEEKSCEVRTRIKDCVKLTNHHKPALRDLFGELEDIADKFQKGNKESVKVNVLCNTYGILGGICGIAGLAAAPFTAGASTALCFVGTGLGGTSGALQLSKDLYKGVVWKKRGEEAVRIVEAINRIFHELYIALDAACKSGNKLYDYILPPGVEKAGGLMNSFEDYTTGARTTKKIWNCKEMIPLFKALRKLKNSPNLARQAVNACAAGRVSEEVVESLGKTVPVAMSKSARLGAMALTGFFIAWDVKELRENCNNLENGTPCAVAKDIRKTVEMMKKTLQFIEDRLEQLNEVKNLL